MKKNLYIFSNTILKRKDSSLLFETIKNVPYEDLEDDELAKYREEFFLGQDIELPSGEKKFIPVESVNAIFGFGTIRLNSRFLYFLTQRNIPLYIFNYSSHFIGAYLPKRENPAGSLLVLQVKQYDNPQKRLFIAQQFIKAAAHNTLANLKYYYNRSTYLDEEIEYIEGLEKKIDDTKSINELMGIEGNIKKTYYSCWNKIIIPPVEFYRRIKNPPPDMINSLISYGNTILYSICLDEIFRTKLYPEISFLHEPGDNRFALSFDIAEIFKPIITDRLIFKLINRNILTYKDFFTKNNFCRIKKEARKIYIEAFDLKLNTVIKERDSERDMSYRRLIREECYKLIKHIEGGEEYKPLRMRW